MPITYKLIQIKNDKIPSMNGKWYARAVVNGILKTSDLASKIQERCTVTTPDILAVVSALVSEIREGLLAGMQVNIESLGTFRIGLKCRSVLEAKDFSIQKDLQSAHVIFNPIWTVNNKKHINTMLTGCKFQEMGNYDKPVKETDQPAAQTQPAA
ncbi:HU family DNA-binding protein [Prevotella cerevisiae]|uniref:HU family DNA-binding protein n=1 Tax=Segatella cerevisiae TaxID=2053716 RepID=A0ABT1BXU1_9BACT|nr:HU family DNA-binding protein [Segatella cerevisiae]MCO6025896.1 HU family DNA-binding protein [Segatella cerevisiae]